MKYSIFLILCIFAFSAYGANNGVEVTLVPTSGAVGTSVDVSFVNRSAKSVCLNGRAIGLDGDSEEFFSIKSNGKKIEYRGISHIRPSSADAPGITLGAGQRILVSMNLSKNYGIRADSEFEIYFESLSFGNCHGKSESLNLMSKTVRMGPISFLSTEKIERLIGVAGTGGAEAAEELVLITRTMDTKQVNERTLKDLASLLDSPVNIVRFWAAAAVGNFGVRAIAYAPRLQKMVSEESCNMTGLSPADTASTALKKMGITPGPLGCVQRK